jgi:tetratricopeptide (TPR) repeat protein
MKLCRNHVVVAVFALAFLLPSALSQQNNPVPKADEMTVWRARRILSYSVSDGIAKPQFTDESIDFEVPNGKKKPPLHQSIALNSMDKLSAKCSYHGFGKGKFFDCEVLNSLGKRVDRHDPVMSWFSTYYWGMANAGDADGIASVQFKAESFVSALNYLHEYAIHPESPLRNFPKIAAEWRAMPNKPAMPEAARVHQLVAEDEVKQRHPSMALFQYEAALEIFPTWPEGWFNAALIAAEVGLFPTAAEHMQAYLALVPDAPDAQKARDQIAVWNYRAGQR